MITANYKLITNADDLRFAVEELSKQQVIGLDTETTDLDPYRGKLRLVQLSTPDEVFIFDLFAFRDVKENEDLKPLRDVLSSSRPVKIAHNAKFDLKWLRLHLGVDVAGLFDTLLSSQIISAGDTEERHSLQSAAARYLNQSLDKSEQLSDWSGTLSESQLRYAASDAAVMIPLREKMVERLKKDNLVRCAQLEFECVLPMAHLELAGIFLDAARWREQLEIVKKKRERFADELQEMLAEGALQGSLFGRAEINLDSHVKVTDALVRLGVPMPENTRGWQLQPLANDYPVVAKLLEYRTVQKALTSYGENILEEINPITGRIHADFYQIGAPTGRMACLTGDTLVATQNGFKRMKDLKAGDFVKTSYGFKRVQHAWMSGIKQVFLVTLKNGQSIRATADHKFLTGLADEWKRLDELKAEDNLFVSLKTYKQEQTNDICKIKVITPNVRSRKNVSLPEALSVELCELIGLIIADGFLGIRHERPITKRRLSGNPAFYDRVCMAFNREDNQLIERAISHSIKVFGQPFKEVKSRSCRTFQLASTKVAAFFAAIGLSGNAHTKKIPDVVLQSHSKYQTAFLRGLFEGDGHCFTNNGNHLSVGLTSVNRKLLSQAQIMLSNLGIYSTLQARNDKSGFSGSKRYKLTISKKSDLKKFMTKIGFISDRKNREFNFSPQQTDGVATPFIISGAKLFKEAKEAGTTEASKEGLKPFSQYYKRHRIKGESVEKLISRFGLLPSLQPVKEYLDLNVRHVEIVSIVPVGNEEVYDITVEDIHEFIANGIVVHNCSNPNIQQVPHGEEYRRCFRAPEKRKFVIADYSQIELRILADVSKDEGFMTAFKSGADLHRATAAQVFNVAPEDVTSEQRSFAKRLNFGVVYGIGAPRFAMMTGVTTEEAEGIMRSYFQTYPRLDAWLRNAGNRAVRDRETRTLSNRLVKFRFDKNDRRQIAGTKRNGTNSPIQGSSADILKRALRLLHDELKETNACLVNVIHDEIVVECDEAQENEIAEKVERAMVTAGKEYVKEVPIVVEAEIKDEWVK